MHRNPLPRPEAAVQVAVLSRMLLEALDACEAPFATEAFRRDLLALREESHALVEAMAVEHARNAD